MVTRRTKITLSSIVLVSAVTFGFAYYYSPPTWRTATREEILGAIDPVLRTPVGPSEDVILRSKRVADVVTKLARQRENRQTLWSAYKAMIQEGPALPYGLEGGDSLQPNPRFTSTLPGYEFTLFAYSGREFGPDSGYYAFTQRCSLRQLQAVVRLSEIDTATGAQMQVDSLLNDAIDRGDLKVSEAKTVLQEDFDDDRFASAIKSAVVGEFWRTDMKSLLRPMNAWPANTWSPKNDGPRPPVGNLDVLETARNISNVYVQLLRNTELPPSEADTSAEDNLTRDSKALPQEKSLGNSSWIDTLRNLKYRWSMNQIQNSYALRYIEPNLSLNSSLDLPRLATARAAHRLLAIKLAAYVFAKDNGRSPIDLTELVRNGYLREVPKDPWSHERLRFNPKTRIVDSVGHDKSLAPDSLLQRTPRSWKVMTGLSFRLP